MTKIILLSVSGKPRLGNQLWNYASIYAYSLEKGYECENYCFDAYQHQFRFPAPSWHKFLLQKFPLVKVISSHNRQINLEDLNFEKQKTVYLRGENFRYETGLKKHRPKIVEAFKPIPEISDKVKNFINQLKKKYVRVIGVHIRQGDYRQYHGGELYFSPKEVRKVIDSYLKFFSLDPKKIVFVIASDEPVASQDFAGLEYVTLSGSPVEDWYTLSQTDFILGSNSTFGTFAAYYGDIPMVMFERPKIDWRKFG